MINMVHNHDHAGVKWGGGAKLGMPPPLVAPLQKIDSCGSYQTFEILEYIKAYGFAYESC